MKLIHLAPNLNLVFLLVLSVLQLTPDLTNALGMKDYGEDCDSSQSYSQYESERCNSDRGLYCNPVRSECKCVISSAYYQEGKCRAKVNNPCGLMDNFGVECVKRAVCSNHTLGVCQCPPDLFGNEAGTACATNNANSRNLISMLLIAAPLLLVNSL